MFIEGEDAHFYQTLNRIINTKPFYKIPFHFHLNIQSLATQKNSDTIIKTCQALENTENFYGILDGDGKHDCDETQYLRNLFHLKRYAKENYVLDPINV